MTLEELRINGDRVRSTLEETAEIGATAGGGLQRLTLNDEDRNDFCSQHGREKSRRS